MSLTNWRVKLKESFKESGDSFVDMICTLTEEELDVKFYDGYGGIKGEVFTAWGEYFVYFPITYDGMEWVGYAPRHPCAIATNHMGGG